ncbi:LysM peptidoglycan-binding domain-containing protein [Brevibacillus halotolerans]|uniref:LysM peptidoglycan-binding domain-containing protein n=1 Tax=Brevibacillus halotolerans TaxID=1507437 RepID=UPI0015EECA6F|nr:LysM peptidoglycan-binding domain-containing protein [Brevibacillus halotolerans]MBA4533411.1 LysM peptidoglycan-binding domain-containing protein [Brevibacillus halotolerans]
MNYTVQLGDTLYTIAQRFGVPMDVLIRVNRLYPPYDLYVGQTLFIPDQGLNPSPNADEERRIARLEREVRRLNERYRDLNRRVRALEQHRRT